ncbi:hypothetical protein [Streptomyces altiplanensis]
MTNPVHTLAAHRTVWTERRVDPVVAGVVERQNRAVRELNGTRAA